MSETIASSLRALTAHRHAEGGWGYRPNSIPQVEPTCLTLLALLQCPGEAEEAIGPGLQRLLTWQEADGAFRVQDGHEGVQWPTALAILTLHRLAYHPGAVAARDRAAAWLLSVQSKTMPFTEEHRRDFEFDPSIVGWGWTEGQFSWVDPTAWSCLALRIIGQGGHERVAEGCRLLLDRALDEGGINAGNRRTFGRKAEPVPENTASLLLALAGLEDHPRLQAARRYLLNEALEQDDLENLCWIRIAFEGWKSDPEIPPALPPLESRIREIHADRQRCEVFSPSLVREALTILALTLDRGNPFASTAEATPSEMQPGRHRSGKSFFDRVSGTFRRWRIMAAGQLRAVAPTTSVHIARAESYEANLASILVEQYDRFRESVPLKDKRVVLKPNLVEYHKGKVINTHPHVIAAAIELCRKEGAKEVVVAEGPGHWRNVEYLVTASGLGDVLRHYKTPFTDLNHDNISKTLNLGQLTKLEHLYFAETILNADVLISMPKLKTHHWAGVTLSLKNLFGVLPGTCYGWPKNLLHWRGIENSIVDIALTRTPDLAIVDGIIGMEGDGPINGEAKHCGVLVMGTDPLAVDATCCRIMELNPEKVAHLVMGSQRKLGLLREAQIEQIGETIATVSTAFTPHPRYVKLRMPRDASAVS